jgi:hypothetical protein
MSPPLDRRYGLSLSSSLFHENLGKKDMTSKPRLNVSICTSRPLPLLFLIFEPGGLFPDDPLSREKGFVRHESLLHPLLVALREGDRVDGLWIECGIEERLTPFTRRTSLRDLHIIHGGIWNKVCIGDNYLWRQ